MLRSAPPVPVPRCSKAPRGLFVLSRVGRIFTATSISPGPSSRQRPDRYTIRAGRNLPDKEFRYLRTVIVTAAVHRGFGLGREALPLTFRHWAGVSPYAVPCGLAGACVFGKQSPGPIHCAPRGLLAARADDPRGSPFSRSYGGNLPSSLTRDHPFAWVHYAPAHLRRSAVRAPAGLPSGFSCRLRPDVVGAVLPLRLPVAPRRMRGDFGPLGLRASTWHLRRHATPAATRPRVSQAASRRYGTINPLSIAYGSYALGLGPTNPTRTYLASEPLGFRR